MTEMMRAAILKDVAHFEVERVEKPQITEPDEVLIKVLVCSICGTDKAKNYCEHVPGRKYKEKLCTVALDDVKDAYEFSFVAVPAQKGAGTVKTYGGEENKPEPISPAESEDVKKELELLALEENRF